MKATPQDVKDFILGHQLKGRDWDQCLDVLHPETGETIVTLGAFWSLFDDCDKIMAQLYAILPPPPGAPT